MRAPPKHLAGAARFVKVAGRLFARFGGTRKVYDVAPDGSIRRHDSIRTSKAAKKAAKRARASARHVG